jgi:aminobenzoyl-glutamate transport protein
VPILDDRIRCAGLDVDPSFGFHWPAAPQRAALAENTRTRRSGAFMTESTTPSRRLSTIDRALAWIERVGNRLPDPAVLFVIALVIVQVASSFLDGVTFRVPTQGGGEDKAIASQLSGERIVGFLTDMVTTFTGFHPLGVVLVALLGVGVAEHSGLIDALIKRLLGITPRALLTPMLMAVGIVSHTAADAGYVLVIPLGGVIFYSAGRHPLAGIAAAFASVSGGFSANFIPSGIDPLLQGLTQAAAQIIDPIREVNPLCNFVFTASSGVLLILIGWYITDRVIEPRLRGTAIDGDPENMPVATPITRAETRGLIAAGLTMLIGLAGLAIWSLQDGSPFRAPPTVVDGVTIPGSLTATQSPLMKSIVPLIFLIFLFPGIVHGYVSGRFKSHRDVVQAMKKTMETMGYYMVLAFFASLFIYAFNRSNIGAYLAVQGAEFLKSAGAPAGATLVGVILICTTVNLLIGSASAKWALLAPILVPMLMQLGISPELTQAAYRVGDSSTNIITPLMPYFPLVVAFSQRYVKSSGLGTIVSLMLPYSVTFLIVWTVFLLLFWTLGIPLGVQGVYTYPP